MQAKDKKILSLIVIAIAVAALGSFLLYKFMTPQKTTIYVFNDNYEAGQVVSDDILTPVTVDSTIAVAGASQDTSTVFVTGQNRRELIDSKTNALRMDVAKGMPLTQSMLSVDGGSYIEMTMNDKKVAVTVPVNSDSGVTNDLKEGSRVNIYSSSSSYGGSSTTLIFENMRVLSVSKSDGGALSAATIECTPEESVKLIDAINSSNIYFGLVNGNGYNTGAAGDTTSTDTQAEESAAPAAQPEVQSTSSPASTSESEEYAGTPQEFAPEGDLSASTQEG